MAFVSKTPWYQYSLRTLLLLFLAIGVALATWRASPGERQRIAVKKVNSVGGKVLYHTDTEFPQSQAASFLRNWLPRDYFDRVTFVSFNFVLDCSDSDLTPLRDFPDLEELALSHTGITDAGLQKLSTLKKLKTLHLDNTQVTDVGLAELPALSSLQALDIARTQVSNAGITHLKRLTETKMINLTGTNCTGHGADELQKALPNCRIILPWM